MLEWREQAIILRCGHFRESDIWLRALLKNRGLHTLFAFGGAKSRYRFCGCLDQFNTLTCRIKASRSGEYWSLEEAALQSTAINLRSDWRRAGLGANCVRFVEACGVGPESAPECFTVTEDMRDRLEEAKPVPRLAPLFFRLRLATALGYAPDFSACAECGAKISPWGFFLVDEGRTLCPGCSLTLTFAQKKCGLKLGLPAIDLLQKVQHNLPRHWPGDADDSCLGQVGRAIDNFVQFHIGLQWNNGTFRRI